MIIVAAVALQAQFCECEELLPGRAVRLAPVRAWQVLFVFTNLLCKGLGECVIMKGEKEMTEIKFENLDKLYESKIIDGICLKRDWDKVRICPNGYESIEEFCWVHNLDLKI